VVADIPGLIPGAHEGKGLGDRFLRHIRRAAVLLYLVDLTAYDRDPKDDVAALSAELHAFDPALADRPAFVALTKIDAGRDRLEEVQAVHPDALPISAVSGEGLDELLRRLGAEVAEYRETAPARTGYVRTVVRPDEMAVRRENQAWRVTGTRAERAVAMTDMNNEEAVRRLQRQLIAMGVEKMLSRSGAEVGDEVRIGDTAFDFEPEDAPAPEDAR
jgi:GTP-binding protein